MSKEWLINWVNDTFGGFSENLNGIVRMLLETPQGFNGDVWRIIMQIFNAILPIAYSLLALMFLMQIIEKMIQTDNQMTFEVVIKLLIKLMSAKMVMANCFTWLNVIFKVTTDIVAAANVKETAAITLTASEKIIDYINNTDMGFFDRIFFFIQNYPFLLMFNLIKIVIQVMVYIRFIELYVMTAMAPLPIATVGNEKVRHIAMKFFQTYIAVCLQGLVILIAIQIYGVMVSSIAINGSMWEVMTGTLAISLVILICIVSSGKIAREMTGAA